MAKSTALGRATLRRGSVLALAAVLVTSGCAAGRDAQTANQVPTQDGTDVNVGAIALRGVAIQEPTNGADYYSPGQAVPLRLVLVNNGRSADTLTNIVTTGARGWASYPTEAEAEQVIAASQTRRQPGSSGPSAPASGSASGTSSASSTGSPSATGSDNGTGSASGTGSPSGTGSSGSVASSSSATAPSSAAAPSTTSLPKPAGSVPILPGRRVSFGVPDSDGGLLLTSATRRLYPGTVVKITFTFARAGSVVANVPVQLTDHPGDLTVAPISSASED